MKAPIQRHCPKCRRVLYNRRLDRCGYCAALIPEELRFSEKEEAEVGKMEAEVMLNQKIRDATEWAKRLPWSQDHGFLP